MTPSPDVTVVIPAHGPTPFLADAVASAFAEGPAEIIVIEDGTVGVTDSTLRGARLVRLSHVGRSRARNVGVEAAVTPYIAFLDEDDVMLPGRLGREQRVLEDRPAAALAFGCIEPIDDEGDRIPAAGAYERRRFERLVQRGTSVESLLADCPIYTSATLVRRDAFLAAGGYDPRLDAYEDLDLYVRLAGAGGLVPVPGAAVSRHRRHAGNTPSDALYEGSLALADKHLPAARGVVRRQLLERRVDALWGLGRFAEARAEVRAALVAEPRLLAHRRFSKRLLATMLPPRVLEGRRR